MHTHRRLQASRVLLLDRCLPLRSAVEVAIGESASRETASSHSWRCVVSSRHKGNSWFLADRWISGTCVGYR